MHTRRPTDHAFVMLIFLIMMMHCIKMYYEFILFWWSKQRSTSLVYYFVRRTLCWFVSYDEFPFAATFFGRVHFFRSFPSFLSLCLSHFFSSSMFSSWTKIKMCASGPPPLQQSLLFTKQLYKLYEMCTG